ncbi:MAG: hypothetical protein R3D00_23100 [Bacteroidia bacterium]
MIRCFTWLFICCIPFSVFAQYETDSLQVDYIYVEKPPVPQAEGSSQTETGKDFLRKRVLLRLDLRDQTNLPLYQLAIPEISGQGIVPALIYGLRLGRIKGLHPSDLRQSFDYFDLVYHLINLDGVQPGGRIDSISLDDVGTEWTYQYLDIIADEGFSPDNSLSFFRIQYIRLLYFNPHTPSGAKIVSVLPYDTVSAFLDNYYCGVEGSEMNVSVRSFFDLKMFRAAEVSIPHDPASPIPLKLPQTPRIRNIDLWKN